MTRKEREKFMIFKDRVDGAHKKPSQKQMKATRNFRYVVFKLYRFNSKVHLYTGYSDLDIIPFS